MSLRRLAADANTSTTAVYSLFGGKQELVQALFLEAFRRFHGWLAAVPLSDDPVADLIALGIAYRESALANPHLYSIMFSRPVPDFQPDPAARTASARTFEPLLDTVRRAVASGAFRQVPPEQIAVAAWGLVHGLVSLELSDCFPEQASTGLAFEASLRAQTDGWRPR